MSGPIPTGAIPNARLKVDPGESPTGKQKRWSFSFRFFKQIENFGASSCESKWFVSMLERLSDISGKTVEEITETPSWMDFYRFHPINWAKKNVPITRNDLNWIDSVYLGNEEEYPLYQFQISKATGRVVGFFDEDWNFNIVLIDPLHNLQPSKYFDYRVTHCFPLDSEYESLRKKIHDHHFNGNGEPLVPDLSDSSKSWFGVLFIDDEIVAEAEEVSEHGFHPNEIFRLGVAELKKMN